MGELQPIAFLMSATLVLAGLFSKDINLQIYEIPTLHASYFFIFTYLSFFIYKLTKDNAFLIIGIFSGFMSFSNIISATLGLNYIIPQATPDTDYTILLISIFNKVTYPIVPTFLTSALIHFSSQHILVFIEETRRNYRRNH